MLESSSNSKRMDGSQARSGRRARAVAAVIAACASLALGAPAALAQVTLPAPPQGYGTESARIVVDAARVLDDASIARINEIAWRVHAGSRGEIAVVTLPSIEGRDVGDIALQIGREWGVGDKAEIGDRARNAGVVVLLVPRETSGDGRGYISIQVGQGAEGFITDGMAGDIRREATPLLQQGAYGPALALITARLAERYAAEFGFALDSTLVPRRRVAESPGISPVAFLLVFIILVVVLGSMGRRGRRGMLLPVPIGRRHDGWGGGGFGGFGGGGFGGGGFGGFGGGGGFSGGGSSGSF